MANYAFSAPKEKRHTDMPLERSQRLFAHWKIIQESTHSLHCGWEKWAHECIQSGLLALRNNAGEIKLGHAGGHLITAHNRLLTYDQSLTTKLERMLTLET